MCGIVGYTGYREASEVLLNTLAKLEYRGYDSVGMVGFENDRLVTKKVKGRIHDLQQLLEKQPYQSIKVGIGHTRWATHGKPTNVNSHPHGNARVALVHNGIIENYLEIKQFLLEKGYHFLSETDTETVVLLLDYYLQNGKQPIEAIQSLVSVIKGSYALGIVFKDVPETIFAIRKDSPLIIGCGNQENFIASDMTALLKYTKEYYLLEENEIAIISSQAIKIHDANTQKEKSKNLLTADWDESIAEKQGYPHFMLKEIFEQPEVFRRTIAGRLLDNRVSFVGDDIADDFFEGIQRIYLIGCGTAYHAGLVTKHLIEKLARIQCVCEIASEFRYNQPLLSKSDLVIIISQSGETADSLAALRLAKQMGTKTLAIVNVAGSSIGREADQVLMTHAQLEIAVASTKAYFAQVVVGTLLAFKLAPPSSTLSGLMKEFQVLDKKVEETLEAIETYQLLARHIYTSDQLFFIGRGLDYNLALEASLKLKEVSYVHCEAYPAGELKHGTISLIEKDTPVVSLISQSELGAKTLNNAIETHARGARNFIFTTIPVGDIPWADTVVLLPLVSDILATLVMIIPLQLIAYYVANLRGVDIDKPRNLAKSVTVE